MTSFEEQIVSLKKQLADLQGRVHDLAGKGITTFFDLLPQELLWAVFAFLDTGALCRLRISCRCMNGDITSWAQSFGWRAKLLNETIISNLPTSYGKIDAISILNIKRPDLDVQDTDAPAVEQRLFELVVAAGDKIRVESTDKFLAKVKVSFKTKYKSGATLYFAKHTLKAEGLFWKRQGGTTRVVNTRDGATYGFCYDDKIVQFIKNEDIIGNFFDSFTNTTKLMFGCVGDAPYYFVMGYGNFKSFAPLLSQGQLPYPPPDLSDEELSKRGVKQPEVYRKRYHNSVASARLIAPAIAPATRPRLLALR